MEDKLIQKYIKEYTIEALQEGENQVAQAADYLLSKEEPGLFNKHRRAKRAALERVSKVFDTSRSRRVWSVVESLGLADLVNDYL